MNLGHGRSSGETDAAPVLPGSLQNNRRLSQWLRVRSDGCVEVFSGKVELGQGITTALAQIAAEELDIGIERVRMIPAVTGVSPDEAVTSGSRSIEESGAALRQACAEARAIYLDAAAARLGTAVEFLDIDDGRIVATNGAATNYWELAEDDLLDREASGKATPRSAAEHRVIGESVARLDLPDKIFGRPRFIHDLDMPGMVHGRMLRPPSPTATLIGIDAGGALAMPGVIGVVRDGSLVGVLAEAEHAADAALQKLAAQASWHESPELPDERSVATWLKAQPVETQLVDVRSAPASAQVVRRVTASYAKPFVAHASIAPSCALAQFRDSRLSVWTHSQGIYNLRRDLAQALGLSQDAIVVQHVEGAGCYGHNAADDVAFDAAWLARAADGRPVRVQWSRADELAWAPFGPAMAIDLEAGLDATGAIASWRHAIWSNGHTARPGRAKTPALLGTWHLERPFERLIAIDPPLAAGGGAERNAVPLYDFPSWEIVNHRLLASPLRTSALRSLGAFANVFAAESFIDELAAATGVDPVAFRLRHLSDPRARAVIERAALNAGWARRERSEGAGLGLGFAKYKNRGAYCAVVAEVVAEREIRVRRLAVAVDVGLVVNPDGVANQIEGGAIQATSWALKEAVRFDRTRVTSDSWETYPILRFCEAPKVEVDILSRRDCPSVGAGEAALGPTAAAIGNAVFDALGVRVRDLPITAERILATPQ